VRRFESAEFFSDDDATQADHHYDLSVESRVERIDSGFALTTLASANKSTPC
jgi:hypothetical protein